MIFRTGLSVAFAFSLLLAAGCENNRTDDRTPEGTATPADPQATPNQSGDSDPLTAPNTQGTPSDGGAGLDTPNTQTPETPEGTQTPGTQEGTQNGDSDPNEEGSDTRVPTPANNPDVESGDDTENQQ